MMRDASGPFVNVLSPGEERTSARAADRSDRRVPPAAVQSKATGVRALVVDNYDSYTFNLVQQIAAISGVWPRVLRNDETAWERLDAREFDCVVISPGPGTPLRQTDLGITRDAVLQSDLPVLAVCLGHQALAYLNGGTVGVAARILHGRHSRIRHNGDELFAGIPSGFAAVRYHSLVVETVPPSLAAIAWSEDGIVMGLRHRAAPQWGVQFHPESVGTDCGSQLIENFLVLAAELRPRPRPGAVRARPHARTVKPAPERLELTVERLPLVLSAESLFAFLYGGERCCFWLDSSDPRSERPFSYMGAADGPLATLADYDVGAARVAETHDGSVTYHELSSIFDYLDRVLRHYAVEAELPFAFRGGLVGYVGYEAKADLGATRAHRSPYPDARFLLAERFLAIDHAERQIYVVAIDQPGRRGGGTRWVSHTVARIAELQREALPHPPAGTVSDFVPDLDRGAYRAAILTCQEKLRAGESYEICLTTQFRAAAEVDPFVLYRALRQANPAPYASFLRFPDLAVLCSSPERFLTIDHHGTVETKPIKGTAARMPDPVADAIAVQTLRSSAKTMSENLMITDVLRNDLGRVAAPGSVQVPVFLGVESYATVHQLVSTVRARVAEDATAVDCLRAMFPGGSMTGAPRLRTMSIIDELEPRARGVYAGTLGYLSFSGSADLNIVIRTMVLRDNQLTFGAGGAITIDSSPEAELDEVALKAPPLLRAIELATGTRPTLAGGWE